MIFSYRSWMASSCRIILFCFLYFPFVSLWSAEGRDFVDPLDPGVSERCFTAAKAWLADPGNECVIREALPTFLTTQLGGAKYALGWNPGTGGSFVGSLDVLSDITHFVPAGFLSESGAAAARVFLAATNSGMFRLWILRPDGEYEVKDYSLSDLSGFALPAISLLTQRVETTYGEVVLRILRGDETPAPSLSQEASQSAAPAGGE